MIVDLPPLRADFRPGIITVVLHMLSESSTQPKWKARDERFFLETEKHLIRFIFNGGADNILLRPEPATYTPGSGAWQIFGRFTKARGDNPWHARTRLDLIKDGTNYNLQFQWTPPPPAAPYVAKLHASEPPRSSVGEDVYIKNYIPPETFRAIALRTNDLAAVLIAGLRHDGTPNAEMRVRQRDSRVSIAWNDQRPIDLLGARSSKEDFEVTFPRAHAEFMLGACTRGKTVSKTVRLSVTDNGHVSLHFSDDPDVQFIHYIGYFEELALREESMPFE